MRNYSTVLKIAPAFLLAGTMLQAQTTDTIDSPRERQIEEVVLIGYGQRKKSDLTGSIVSVSAKDFNGGATSPEQLIQGKAPGVSITGNGGAPGAGSTIRIRGGASLNANSAPLIVIDGVPQDFSGVSGASDPLSLINPNDIESFDILKDASAAAIYGNRASNGVILITTKKGTAGKLRVNFSTVASVSTKMGNADVLEADAYRAFVNEVGTESAKALLGTASTNWQDLIYQEAWGTDNNVAISGGIKGLPYRLSLGYNEQNGIVKTNEFRRTSVGLNLNPKFFDNHLTVNASFKGSFTDNRFPDGGAINNAIYFDPTQPVYMDDQRFGGYFEWLNSDGGLNTVSNRNPLGLLNATRNVSSVYRLMPSLQLDYKLHFLPEMRWNVNVAYDYSKGYGSNYTNGFSGAGNGFHNVGPYEQEKKNKLFETYLNYVKTLSALDTNVDLMVGHSYQDFFRDTPAGQSIRTNATTGETELTPFRRYADNLTLLSFYGRAIFTIKDKYILTASLRRDGSSRFYNGTTDNVWGNFPAAAFAWKINEENFLNESQNLSTLKLRLGYGITGQQEVGGTYPSFARYQLSNDSAEYLFGDAFYPMYRAEQYNPFLTWEKTLTQNIGLDFGFFSNRISGSVDVFQKDTEDLIAYVPEAAGGLSNYNTKNVGDMVNKGIEVVLNFTPVKTENTTWDVNLNATHYTSEITSLSDQVAADFKIQVGGLSGGVGNNIQAHTVGQAPYSFYVYKQLYDTAGNPVPGAYADVNADGVVNDSDKYFYKSTTPDALFGFSTKVTHKNWDFSTSLRAVLGNYVYNNAASNSSLASLRTNGYLQNVYSTTVNYQFPQLNLWSDAFVEDASFLRMDNLTVGYNFGELFGDRSNLRVYGMAQNVFVISDYTGVDPEIFGNIDNGFYQRPKVYSLGLNFQF
ncbi:SusC/RagA family TonB-linked outer membrane protein [Planobacterium oryzisoli]|uniref:SusC/RagA family TonB-linked outer membrane protein n=1 Tax=Planobacterium oryzisoli TaxID=2771435 RepID=A0A930YWP7_9FLAO|nr:SusC/RagA family TonB-linked outer membrane protein [Planobacterium oryzisoli]MBF5027808.1 SusC/RagA family TonB-linked outer membrane protein [Planobacterium oryzisoli]